MTCKCVGLKISFTIHIDGGKGWKHKIKKYIIINGKAQRMTIPVYQKKELCYQIINEAKEGKDVIISIRI